MFEKLFSLNLADYFEGSDLRINQIVFFLGIFLALLFLLYAFRQRAFLVTLQKLLRAKAFDEENAKTLTDLHLTQKSLVLWLLSHASGRVAHLIKLVDFSKNAPPCSTTICSETKAENAEKTDKKQTIVCKYDVKSARIYLPSDLRQEAEYVCENNNFTLFGTVLLSLLILGITALLFFFMPDILAFLQRILTG